MISAPWWAWAIITASVYVVAYYIGYEAAVRRIAKRIGREP